MSALDRMGGEEGRGKAIHAHQGFIVGEAEKTTKRKYSYGGVEKKDRPGICFYHRGSKIRGSREGEKFRGRKVELGKIGEGPQYPYLPRLQKKVQRAKEERLGGQKKT